MYMYITQIFIIYYILVPCISSLENTGIHHGEMMDERLTRNEVTSMSLILFSQEAIIGKQLAYQFVDFWFD